ncbi:hypothetical protein [Winogradskyella ouciana]|uniref:hypothetical protein n=1 Tax=Winogradskyella ouciana TaxID=2608631 RepID=UPI003D280582
MSYFGLNSVEEEERRNRAFQMLSAMREALTISKRTRQAIPYKRALQLVNDFDPELFKDFQNLLTKTNESEIVKYYKQKAEALSLESGHTISPEQLIQKDLDTEIRIRNAGENTNLIQRKVFELESALEYFQPEDISENYILNHDFSLTHKHEFFNKKIYDSAKVKDYELTGNRVLRLRLLHPDKAERIIGSDLVYEQFDLKSQKVRFIHIQYKTWNTKTLYFSQGNMIDQIEKLDKNICKSGYCQNEKGSKFSSNYRFPYCSAFLRPTSFLTKPDASLISSGIHLPVCMVNKIRETDKKVDVKNSKGKSVGHRIFEELFIDKHIGSRWLTFNELEQFYKEKGITSETGRIRVHAQEVIDTSKTKENNGS